MSPKALTATSAETTSSPSRTRGRTEPAGTGVLAAAPLADRRAGAGADRPDRRRALGGADAAPMTLGGTGPHRPSPTSRSNSDSPTTIGTGPAPVAKPTPASARWAITPSPAASPNAEPPESTSASMRSTRRSGASSANSRVAGAPPRTSPDATVPSGNSTTVHPVRATASVQWPDPHAGDLEVVDARVHRPRRSVGQPCVVRRR